MALDVQGEIFRQSGFRKVTVSEIFRLHSCQVKLGNYPTLAGCLGKIMMGLRLG